MKISIVEVAPVPPPKKVILEMTPEEVDLIYIFSMYYVTGAWSAPSTAAAKRLAKLTKQFHGSAKYPYENAFKEE